MERATTGDNECLLVGRSLRAVDKLDVRATQLAAGLYPNMPSARRWPSEPRSILRQSVGRCRRHTLTPAVLTERLARPVSLPT